MTDEPPTHCDHCGGPFTRPGESGCEDGRHRAPDLAQRIVAIVERALNDRDRANLGWSWVDEPDLFELRDDLAREVRKVLDLEGVKTED